MRDSLASGPASPSQNEVNPAEAAALVADLLAWYDQHARKMPWRIAPSDRAAGLIPDPYRVWLSEVMLQQTTVAAVKAYFLRFTARWPTVFDLAAAKDEDVMAEWAGLGYYARARNLLKCARAVAERGGFPTSRDGLLTLPGIGPYTAGAVAAIAYDEAAVVVDGNVERVMSRLFLVETPLPAAKPELTRLAAALTPSQRPGDYAQAVMDLGATICTPRSPACGICPWLHPCRAQAAGVTASLPRKLAKAAKPQRQGVVWLLRTPQAWLLERRAAKGLLGGMLGLPGDSWDGHGGAAPADVAWTEAGEVGHVFTHFSLTLRVMVAAAEANPLRGELIPHAGFSPDSLPTVFRKAFDLGAKQLGTTSL